jgi:hypothetical protein
MDGWQYRDYSAYISMFCHYFGINAALTRRPWRVAVERQVVSVMVVCSLGV